MNELIGEDRDSDLAWDRVRTLVDLNIIDYRNGQISQATCFKNCLALVRTLEVPESAFPNIRQKLLGAIVEEIYFQPIPKKSVRQYSKKYGSETCRTLIRTIERIEKVEGCSTKEAYEKLSKSLKDQGLDLSTDALFHIYNKNRKT